jgi:glycosyltransferase involved in cell wall biosynthesis
MRVSYAITVKDERSEIEQLLGLLKRNIDSEDEIVIVWDSHNGSQEVLEYLYANKTQNMRIENFYFQNNFSDLKNYLNSLCSGEYIFNIDADELLDESLFSVLKIVLESNSQVDLFYVPRINTVEGLTDAHVQKWGWKLNENGWINFPDYQARLYKNIPEAKWSSDVHETVNGSLLRSTLPIGDMFCLRHHKKIDRQEKQNALYEQILREKNG